MFHVEQSESSPVPRGTISLSMSGIVTSRHASSQSFPLGCLIRHPNFLKMPTFRNPLMGKDLNVNPGKPSKRFPQPGRVLHRFTSARHPLPSFNLKCHGKDSRRSQPKGWRGQNHHRHQSFRLPRARGPQNPPRRLRSPGKCLLRPGRCPRRQSPFHLRRPRRRLRGRTGHPAQWGRQSLDSARLEEPYRRQYRVDEPPKTAPFAFATPSPLSKTNTTSSFSTARRLSICSP